MPTLVYTAARTRREEPLVTRYGTLIPGDLVTVPDEVARRWTTLHPSARAAPRDPEAYTRADLMREALQVGLDLRGHLSRAQLAGRLDAVAPARGWFSDFEYASGPAMPENGGATAEQPGHAGGEEV